MIFVLFALALLASLRGWFPWTLVVFLTPYLSAILDRQVLAAESGELLALFAGIGGPVDWLAGALLAAMVLRPRE